MHQSVIDEVIAITPQLKSVDRVEFLNRGFSPDKKYILWEFERPCFLLRISPLKLKEKRQREFDLLKLHYARKVPCSKPICWGTTRDDMHCFTVVSYLPGTCAEELLPQLSESEQFKYGWQASQVLRQLHSLPCPDPDYNWPKRRIAKYRRKVEETRDQGLHFYKQEEIERYIEEHLIMLNESPVRFQHDDFHPGNIIIDQGGKLHVIDFNRCDWGDPIEDFFKLPKYTCPVSIPFACGQISGYCDGTISSSFWQRYNLFVALNQHASLLGAHLLYHDQLVWWQRRIAETIDSHDFRGNGPPSWFRTYIG